MRIRPRTRNGRLGRNILTRPDLEAPPSEQDFLLTNYPIFLGKNVNDYAEFLELIASPRVTWRETFRFIIKLLIFFAPLLRQLWIFL